MAINKVVYDGNTLIDLTGDTVDASNLLVGYTAHDRSGALIQGAFDPSVYVLKAGDTMTGTLTVRNTEVDDVYNKTRVLATGIEVGLASSQGIIAPNVYITKDGVKLNSSSLLFETNSVNAIKYAGTYGTYTMIKFKDGSDQYGNGIIIGGGGLSIIGGGESANVVAEQYSYGGDEVLELVSDGAVYIRTNLNNGWNSRKTFTFGSNGYLTVGDGGIATVGDITVNNAASEKVIRIGTQSGAQVSLCFGTSLNQGVYSSGYTTDISDSSKYTSSGLWIIARGSDGNVTIPNWASIGNSTTPVYINAAGRPTPVSSIDVSNADYLKEADTRNDDFLPSTYMSSLGRKMRYEFKTRATIGAPGSSTYVSMLTFSPWADSSGGRPSQLSIDSDGTIGFRISGNDSQWNAWNKLVTTKSDPATAPKYLESSFARSDTPINQPGHLYDNSRVHMRVDGVFNSPVAFGNYDGFTLSFFWDNSGAYDSQLFIPNGDGEPLIRLRKAANSWSTNPNDQTYYRKLLTNKKTTVTPTRNATNTYEAASASVVVQGNVAYVNALTIVMTSSGIVNGATLFTGFPKPTTTVRFGIFAAGTGGGMFQCIIDTDGNLKMDTSGTTAQRYYYANICYPIS